MIKPVLRKVEYSQLILNKISDEWRHLQRIVQSRKLLIDHYEQERSVKIERT